MGTVKLKSSDEVFQLKISLLGSDPEIWRTIQISSAATLSRLHKAIQSAFDWEDSHLHEFTTIKHEKINKRQKLKEVLRVGKKIIYTYDFGDCWEHLITVESRLMCAELAGDFHLGDSRQLTDKSLLPFDLVS